MKNITYQNTGKIIMICLVYTLILTIAPLVGWSYYSLESSLIQCGVEWAERSWNVQSYNFTILDDAKIKEKIDQERQLTIMMLVYISIICLNWLYLREIIFLII